MSAKLTKEQVEEIRQRWQQGELATDLAREFGVDRGNMSRILRQYTWKSEPLTIVKRNITFPHEVGKITLSVSFDEKHLSERDQQFIASLLSLCDSYGQGKKGTLS